MDTIPLISLEKLLSADSRCEQKRLVESCENLGFFCLTDMGLPEGLVENTISKSKEFFKMDDAFKNKFAHREQVVVPRSSRGYVPLFGEALESAENPDCKQLFDFGIEQKLDGRYFVGPTLMPSEDEAPGFSRANLQLQNFVISNVAPVLLEAFATGLGLKRDGLLKHFRDPVLIHRVIHYPRLIGDAGKHTDSGIMTILFQEVTGTPSLYVQSKNEWIAVPSRKDVAVVNLGDMLQYWTGGRFASTPHFVKHEAARPRVSIPFFIYPDVDSELQPIDDSAPFCTIDILLENFSSIWVEGTGAGRAKDLK